MARLGSSATASAWSTRSWTAGRGDATASAGGGAAPEAAGASGAEAPEEPQGEPGPEAAAGPPASSRSQGHGHRRDDSSAMMDLGVDEILKTMLSARGGSEPDASSRGV
mmetsp:Transcript_88187/g.276174  ORF Transcript_88187/g.276174 Transcript_88187/m.276174 type:complete len:109 (-) Transcript_88187:89-415(-)